MRRLVVPSNSSYCWRNPTIALLADLRVALVHHWLVTHRGGEKVLESFCRLFPRADLLTLVHARGALPPLIEDRTIVTSPLQRVPGAARHYPRLLPLMPWATRHLDARGYDLVLSSDASVIKGLRTDPGQLHVCYCHSPPRYAWGMTHAYVGTSPLPVRAAAALTMARVRRFDRRAAGRVTDFIANSANVADRIARFYGRPSTVIHPPVDLDRFRPVEEVGEHYLVAGQLVPYKRADVAVRAFAGLGRELRVLGDGPSLGALRELAPPNVRFLGRVDDETWAREMARCRALIFPGEEDFGIVPLEAMASGRPVIALGRGGALETVVGPLADDVDGDRLPAGCTGLFVRDDHPHGLAEAVRVFERVAASISPGSCRARAEEFAEPRFRAAVAEHLRARVEEHVQASR